MRLGSVFEVLGHLFSVLVDNPLEFFSIVFVLDLRPLVVEPVAVPRDEEVCVLLQKLHQLIVVLSDILDNDGLNDLELFEKNLFAQLVLRVEVAVLVVSVNDFVVLLEVKGVHAHNALQIKLCFFFDLPLQLFHEASPHALDERTLCSVLAKLTHNLVHLLLDNSPEDLVELALLAEVGDEVPGGLDVGKGVPPDELSADSVC